LWIISRLAELNLCGEFKVFAFLADCPYWTLKRKEVASNHRERNAPGHAFKCYESKAYCHAFFYSYDFNATSFNWWFFTNSLFEGGLLCVEN